VRRPSPTSPPRLLALGLALAVGACGVNKATSVRREAPGRAIGVTEGLPLSLPVPSTAYRLSLNQRDVSRDLQACPAQQAGLGACSGDYLVFCEGGRLRALDCAILVNVDLMQWATCGPLQGVLICGYE
jgi:hypothetical protein